MNPFDQLRADDTAVAPDPRFAARLRTHVEAALAPDVRLPDRRTSTTQETTVSDTTTVATAAPAATQIITPYITVNDGAGALQWYADALGATETMRYTGDDGRVGHAEILVHGARIYLSDAYPEIGVVAADSYEGSSCALHLEVADCDAAYARAVEHGAVSQREPDDQGHGSRTATVVDPYGHRWMLNQTIAAPSADEIQAATPGFTVEDKTVTPDPDGRPIQLGYYSIRTDDVAAAASFYSRLFGWEVDSESGFVSNCDLPFSFQNQYNEGYRLWLTVKDPEPVIARVLELGGEIVSDEVYESGRAIECRDDQGRSFDLHKPAPGYE